MKSIHYFVSILIAVSVWSGCGTVTHQHAAVSPQPERVHPQFTSNNVLRLKYGQPPDTVIHFFGPPDNIRKTICGKGDKRWSCVMWTYEMGNKKRNYFFFNPKYSPAKLNNWTINTLYSVNSLPASEPERPLHGTPKELFKAGNNYMKVGLFQKAVVHYRAATAKAPNFAAAWYNLGLAYRRLQLWAEEFDAFKRALAAKPTMAAAWLELGVIHHHAGRTQAAFRCYREVIRLNPGSIAPLIQMGVLYTRLGQLKLAVDTYLKAIAIKPKAPQPHYNIAIVLERAADKTNKQADKAQLRKAAKREYRKTVKLQPKHFRAWYNLSIILHKEKKYVAEMRALKNAIKAKKRYHKAQYNLAIVYGALGRKNDALLAFYQYVADATGVPEEQKYVKIARQQIAKLKGNKR